MGAGTGCPASGSGDQSIDPAVVFTSVLGPLQDNGGPAATRALLPGSPAIDAASACPPPAQDQRSITRPQGAACNIGAYEARNNQRPVANAGPDQQVEVVTRVLLDGNASSDPETDPISYQWSFISLPPGNVAVLETPTESRASFVPDQVGNYEVQLQVRDSVNPFGASDAALITAEIRGSTNQRPIADAGADQTVTVGARVILNGSASNDPDSDGNIVQYEWAFVSKPVNSQTSLINPTDAVASFVADFEGSYEVHLRVYDSIESSAPDTIRITAERGGSESDEGGGDSPL